jgi:hypothetical protein
MEEDDNLPVRASDRSSVERLLARLRRLDGPLSGSHATVPKEAVDIGEVPYPPNPKSGDLADADMDCDNGYPEGYELAVEREAGKVVFSDPPMSILAGDTHIVAEEGDVIEDVTTWA